MNSNVIVLDPEPPRDPGGVCAIQRPLVVTRPTRALHVPASLPAVRADDGASGGGGGGGGASVHCGDDRRGLLLLVPVGALLRPVPGHKETFPNVSENRSTTKWLPG